jgi:hypothetical protein
VYGPVRTVVWQGSAGNRCPYADRTSHSEVVMLVLRRIRLRPPAARSAFDKMAVVKQTVEHGGDRGAVPE